MPLVSIQRTGDISRLNAIVATRQRQHGALGAGLTWASPFGALTVDYAVPLTKAAYDVVQPFRFSAGGF